MLLVRNVFDHLLTDNEVEIFFLKGNSAIEIGGRTLDLRQKKRFWIEIAGRDALLWLLAMCAEQLAQLIGQITLPCPQV